MKFSVLLEKQLRKTKMTYVSLAYGVGVNKQAVYAWRDGKRKPGYETAKVLAVLWGLEVDHIMNTKK